MDHFETLFRQADLDQDGKISGAEAVGFFQGFGLPKQVLAQTAGFGGDEKSATPTSAPQQPPPSSGYLGSSLILSCSETPQSGAPESSTKVVATDSSLHKTQPRVMDFDLNMECSDVEVDCDGMGEFNRDAEKDNIGDDDVAEVLVIEDEGVEGDLMMRILEEGNGEGVGRGRTLPVGADEVQEPKNGMEFRIGEEFVAYVHRYAFSKGFQACIRSSEKEDGVGEYVPPVAGPDGTLMETHYLKYWKIRMACQKFGVFKSRSKNPNRCTQSCKTNCMFRVNARKDSVTGWWKISHVAEPHNHTFAPAGSRHLPRYRTICLSDQKLIIELSSAGVRVPRIFNVFVNQYKGYTKVPFTEVDMRNFIYYHLNKPLKEGDFAAMEVHFKKMREMTPNFFYEYDVDDKYKLKNIFWADSRCREAFKEFGDTVTFDTTYLSNRYRMPFAPFIAVNHHGKSMLLGCALLGKEDTESFVWLFKTWRKCMGKDPLKLLTDQDKTIEIAFPQTKHRWCIWHVMQNARRHLGSLSIWKDMSKDMKSALHDSFTIEEFESRWMEMVTKYKMEENSWISDMYKKRAKWVPVFFKSEFWAGMSSTQRSEGINNFFKGYVDINTNLTQFVEKYGEAVCKRMAEEGDDTFNGSNRRSRTTDGHPFEDVFEQLLTRDKFLEFHEELTQMKYNSATKVSDDQRIVVYDILVKKFRVGWTRRKNFIVRLDRHTMDIKCDCRNFEFRGILCPHALRVFWEEEIMDVPEKYILNRWRKDIPRSYLKEDYPQSCLIAKTPVGFQRYKAMHDVCDEICVMLMNNESLYNEGLEHLLKLKSGLRAKTDSPDGISTEFLAGIGRVYRRKKSKLEESDDGEGVQKQGEEEDVNLVKDPTDKRGRGRGQTKRKKSCLEKTPKNVHGRGRGRGRGKSSAPNSTTPNNQTRCDGPVSFSSDLGETGGGEQVGMTKLSLFSRSDWISL